MSQKQISDMEASLEASRVFSDTDAAAEVKSHRHSRKKARKVDKDSEHHSQSDTSAGRKVERSRSRTPHVAHRVTEFPIPSPQVGTAPSISVPCIATATCTTSTVTTVMTPISSTGARPPFQFAVTGAGQHVQFAQPISSFSPTLGGGST